MTDSPSHPDPNDTTGTGPDRTPDTATPRWVKVSWLIAAALILLFIALHLTGLSPAGH